MEVLPCQLVRGISREDWNFLLCDGQLRGDVLEKCSLLALDKFVKAVTTTALNFGEYFYISSLQFGGIMANYNRPEAALRASFPTSQLLIVSFYFCLDCGLHSLSRWIPRK